MPRLSKEAVPAPAAPAKTVATPARVRRAASAAPPAAPAKAPWTATWTFLRKVWVRLDALLNPPKAEPETTARETHGTLRFTDLDLDAPEDALQALRRASRTPPHQRHIREFEGY